MAPILLIALPATLASGLTAHGVDRARGERSRRRSDRAPATVSVLFASLLGYNPVHTPVGKAALAK